MKGTKLNRRDFLRLMGGSSVALYLGCHSANYYVLNHACAPIAKRTNTLRVMTYNIANARGNNDNLFEPVRKETTLDNLDWIVELIRTYDIDVVCMNEVDFNSIRTYNIDMPEYIAKALCYNHVIKERIFDIPSILDLGNAVVSKFPLHLIGHHQYGDGFINRAKHIFKSFVDFDVLGVGLERKLNMVLTHLDHHDETTRCNEVEQLRAYLLQKTNPFVLLGDLNATPDSLCFKRLLESDLVLNPNLGVLSYPSDVPTKSIDHILVSRGLSIDNYHTVSMQASDHLPVIADIKID